MKFIVECGCNFHSIEEAKLMISKAKEIGAFLCKFQLYNDNLIKDSKDYAFLKSIQLDYEKAKELYDYGQSIGQEVFFTPMYLEAVDICEKIGVKWYKIRFLDRNNKKLLDRVIRTDKPYFCSRNHHYLNLKPKFQEITLYCVPEYPTVKEKYVFDWSDFQGISDHTSTIDLLKYSKNNTMCDYFEKHCCLTKDCLEAPWSSTFDELKEVLK